MDTDNTVSLPFKDNQEFRDYIGRKEVGDTCRITVDFQITDIGEEKVSGVIAKPEAVEHASITKVESGDENSPVMMVIGKSKNAKGSARPASVGY